MLRHLFRLAKDDGFDHDVQVAWNALSRLELKLTAAEAQPEPAGQVAGMAAGTIPLPEAGSFIQAPRPTYQGPPIHGADIG